MKATYRIHKTPDHLIRMGVDPFYIEYIVGSDTDWDYTNRCRKFFFPTQSEAEKAGKRYLAKMKKNGFQI